MRKGPGLNAAQVLYIYIHSRHSRRVTVPAEVSRETWSGPFYIRTDACDASK